MITLNTEHITIEQSQSLFRSRLLVVLRQPTRILGDLTLQPPNNGWSDLYLFPNKEGWTYEQQDEFLLGLAQYLFHIYPIKGITVRGYKGFHPMVNVNLEITPDTIKAATKTLPIIHCAIAVIKNSKGEILLGMRPLGKFMPDIWEFPGGKFEFGETETAAASRELHEELGITVQGYVSRFQIDYVFKHFRLKGHVGEVTQWEGYPKPYVHKQLLWVTKQRISDFPMPLTNLLFLKDI